MHSRGLLRVNRDEGLGYGLLDLSFDEGGQVRRQNMRKMTGDVGTKEKFLNLDRETLKNCV